MTNENDFIKRGDAVLAVTAADKECLGANGAREFILALPAAPTFTAASRSAAVKALSLTRRADDLREAYHRLPNDKNRIGDKKSKKSRARDAWLRAFRKAAKEARAALAALPAAPTFTAADLERAWEMGRDAVLADVQELRDAPSIPPGNERAEVYNEACDNILRFAVGLSPPADLAERVKE